MAKKKKQTIGYKYFASGHFVLCHGPIDSITKISFNDKSANETEHSENLRLLINRPALFGGDEQQGGIAGYFFFLFGRSNQEKHPVFQRIWPERLQSAWRGITSVVMENVYIGTAPNMPDSKWRVKRIHTRHDGQVQWYDEKAEIFSPIQGDSVAYNFDRLSWDLVGDPNTVNQDGAIYCDFKSDTQFTVYSLDYDSDKVFDIFVNVTAKTELNGVSGGEAVDGYEWISKGGVYTNPLVNEYKIIISDPPQTYLLNKGTFEIPYKETERFARLKLQVKNGGTVRCVCDTIDKYMATGENGATDQYMHFDAASSVDQDINPAHIIRECLTNQVWGIGVSGSNIDDVSFKNAADKLYSEKMGMSIKWTDSTSINEFVDNIKEHINAQLYLDRVTNKWKLYLIRDDYAVADLISLNESNIRNLDFERRTLAECVNSVTVTYWDRERAKDSTVTVQDIARIAQQGGVISQSIDYKGFTNSDLASRVALRDLKTLSSTLATVSFDVDESFSESWHEGMPFKLSDESYGLSEAVMRIRTIKRGDGINNTVYVEAIEDSFSSPMQSVVEYVPPITSGDSIAQNATAIAFEVPYIELVEQYGQDEVDAKLSNYPELGYVGMAAIRPNNQHINASLYVNAGAGYDERTTLDFCPSASLRTDIGYVDSSFELEKVAEFELLEANHRIQVNDEIMAFVSFDTVTNVITVKRGCFDTVPQKHVAGSKLFGWDNYSGIDDLEYLSGENVSLKALTLTGSDVLELSEATTHSLILSSRAIRPYPPANVEINGEYYPQDIETDLILTWVDRNRLQETGGEPLGFFNGAITAEADTLYQLILIERDENNVEIRMQNLSIGSVNTYTFATSAMHVNTRTIQIVLRSLRDGYESYQSFTHTVELSQFFSAPYNITYTVVDL